jgi:hypothetical protein
VAGRVQVVPPEPGDVLVAGVGMSAGGPVEPPGHEPAPEPLPQPEKAPEKKRKSRAARVVVGCVGAVAVLAGGATAYVLVSGGEESRKNNEPRADAPVAGWAVRAGRDMRAMAVVQYDGALRGEAGQSARLRLKVTRSGAATGRLSLGGRQFDVVTVGGDTYIKADTAFWRRYGTDSAHPENYAGRWSKAPESMPGLDVANVLAPESIARALVKASGKASLENVGGTPVYRVKTPKADYLVTRSAPYRLLRVQVAGNGDPALSVTRLTQPAPVFTELRPRVAALVGAADPSVRFRAGKLTFLNCNENVSGCTVSVPATMTVPESGPVPQGARAALRATITADGRTLGSCTGSGAVPANRSLVLRCTVRSAGWRAWMRQARDTPGEHAYEAQARVVGQALTAGEVGRLLARLDRERAALAPARRTTPSAGASAAVSPTGRS